VCFDSGDNKVKHHSGIYVGAEKAFTNAPTLGQTDPYKSIPKDLIVAVPTWKFSFYLYTRFDICKQIS